MSVKPDLENYNIENFIKSIKTQKPSFLSLNCDKKTLLDNYNYILE